MTTKSDEPPGIRRQLDQAADLLQRLAYREAHAVCMNILQAAPETAEAYYLLGVLTADHDNHTKACEIFDRALALNASDGRYRAEKARSLIALNRRADAIDAVQSAAKCSDLTARTHDTIGVVLSRAGLHDQATPHYAQATGMDASQASYWYNYGAALQFQGAFDQSREAYRAVLGIDPSHVKAWSGLIQITPQTADNNAVAELEAIFETLTDADETLTIGHALAKSHEDLGNLGKAMDWLARAKADKKARLDSRAGWDARLFAAAAKTAVPGDTDNGGCSDASPIFIVGLPRTGTTLVDRILSSHDQVVSAGELSDFSLATKREAGTPSAFVLDEATLEAAQSADLARIGAAYIDMARRTAGPAETAPRFVDKMPLNIFYAGLISRALPNARIICLRRHPADSVLSNYRQLFATGFSYYNYAYDLVDSAQYYVRFDALVATFRASLPTDRFTEVWYEDVVSDLETQARRLVDFCGLNWQPECVDFHRNAAPVATASSAQVRQPLYSSSVGRWTRVRSQMAEALGVLEANGLLDDTPN